MSINAAFDELEHRLEGQIKKLDKILKEKDGADVNYWELYGERNGLRTAYAQFLITKTRWADIQND